MGTEVIDIVLTEMRELRAEVKGLREEMAEQRGARQMARLAFGIVSGAAGAVFTIAGKVLLHWS